MNNEEEQQENCKHGNSSLNDVHTSSSSRNSDKILIEIVSAGFTHKPGEKHNVYCLVKDHDDQKKVFHQTSIIRQNSNPIWTVKTKSLVLIDADGLDINRGLVDFELIHKDFKFLLERSLGKVTLRWKQILQGDGSRVEHKIYDGKGKETKKTSSGGICTGTISLRYRHPEPNEVRFMNTLQISSKMTNITSLATGFANIPHAIVRKTLAPISPTQQSKAKDRGEDESNDSSRTVDVTFFRESSFKKTRSNPVQVFPKIPPLTLGAARAKKPSKPGDKLIKVKPYCNPNHAETTTWMTKSQLRNAALQPSLNWIEAGEGNLGKLYIEIIKCKNLPNMDTGVAGDLTDAYVAMVYEDVMVRTDVIHDELSPEFPPWMDRAYSFPIQHPASLLFLGVFDQDPMTDTPIGRVVIDLSNFQANTVYLLDYKLQSNTNLDQGDQRGVITIRLRLDWNDEKEAFRRAFHAPPHYRVNVPTQRTFKILRYLCRGELDMEKSTMGSVKEYAYELLSYFDSYLSLVDSIARILLWRGRIVTKITKPKKFWSDSRTPETMTLSLWFPLRSILAFLMAINCVERPSLIPSMFFYSIGLVMFNIMYSKSRCPSPWKQTRKLKDILKGVILGQHIQYVKIDPYDGHEQSLTLEELDKARIERVKNLLFALKTFLLRLRREKKKLDPYYHLTPTTVRKNVFKVNVLNILDSSEYLHLILSMLCYYLRGIRNVITWKSYCHSFVLTMYCFFFGTVFLILPMDHIVKWFFRILVLATLGPWMKLVDIFYVMPYYPPPDKDTSKLSVQEPDFDRYWDSPSYKVLAKKIHIAEEAALKIRDMREYRFGPFMETVPIMDLSRYPSVPEPTSSARPFQPPPIDSSTTPTGEASFGYEYLPKNSLKWRQFSGQKLHGDMIPHTDLEVRNNTKEKTS